MQSIVPQCADVKETNLLRVYFYDQSYEIVLHFKLFDLIILVIANCFDNEHELYHHSFP